MSEPAKPVEAKRPDSKINWGAWIVVLGFLGVVVAGALFAAAEWRDGAARAQNMEAVYLLKDARVPLSDYFQDHGKWPENLDKIDSTRSGTRVKSVGITRGAGGAGEIELTATMRSEGLDERVAGKTMLLISSDGGKTWTCKLGTMPPEHVPYECRN